MSPSDDFGTTPGVALGEADTRAKLIDLASVKVGKKTPFTREKLKEFFSLLPTRGDSERSWTVDFAARRKRAKVEADAIRAQTAAPRAELAGLKEKEAALKKFKDSAGALSAVREHIVARKRETRALEAKAQGIEDAAYDLKAVNPNAKSEEDARTPSELLDFIESKGREIAESLVRPRTMALSDSGSLASGSNSSDSL